MQTNDPKTKRPSADEADKALHEVVEAERDQGDVNPGAEPDQKSEIPEPGEKSSDEAKKKQEHNSERMSEDDKLTKQGHD